MRVRIFVCLILAVMVIGQRSAWAEPDYRIGILASPSRAKAAAMFQSTADHLGYATYGQRFELVPLGATELAGAVAGRRVDFIVTSPEQFIELQARYRAQGIANLVRVQGGVRLRESGGVILVRGDRADLVQLGDLRGKLLVAGEREYLSGYLAQAGELAEAGLDIRSDSRLETNLAPDQVLRAVASGQADAGFLPAGVIETLASEGRVRLDSFRVLNVRRADGFPFMLSTRLYPDLIFAGLSHVPEAKVKQVAAALMTMNAEDALPWQGGHVEWTMPLGLESVHQLMRAQRLAPYDKDQAFDLREVLRKHEFEAFAVLVIGTALLLAVLLKFRRLNHRLAVQVMLNDQRRRELEGEIAARQKAESQLRLNASVFENATEGIIVTDPAGTIIDINEAFTRMTGYDRGDAIGQNPRFLKSGRHDRAFYTHMWACIGETGQWRGEIWNRRKDGKVFVEMLHIAGVRGADMRISHYVATFNDITVLKETQARLSQATYGVTDWPN